MADRIAAVLRTWVAPAPEARVTGGCINECFRWRSGRGYIFVKVAPASRGEMFSAEAAGLAALRDARAVRVPEVLGVDDGEKHAVLVLEWIELTPPSPRTEAELGARLARQHRVTASLYGWHRDNTIGATAQVNTPAADWSAFFRDRRLSPQLSLAAANGYGGRWHARGERLLAILDGFFATYHPAPSLLHGDLWSGNRAADAAGMPVIFDPAVYHGDRETDVAMTRLFGGFGPDFYAAYEAESPLDSGASSRVALYNLYHVLNHLNLFGDAYLERAISVIDRLLAEQAA